MPIPVATIALSALFSQGIGLVFSALLPGRPKVDINQPIENLKQYLEIISKDFSRKTEEAIRAAFLNHSFYNIKTDTDTAFSLFTQYLQSLPSHPNGEQASLDSATTHITRAYQALKQHCDELLRTQLPTSNDMAAVKRTNAALEITITSLYAIASIDLFILSKRFQLFPSLITTVEEHINEYTAYTNSLVNYHRSLQPRRVSYKPGTVDRDFVLHGESLQIDGDPFITAACRVDRTSSSRTVLDHGNHEFVQRSFTEISQTLTFTYPSGAKETFSRSTYGRESLMHNARHWLIKQREKYDPTFEKSQEMMRLWQKVMAEGRLQYQLGEMQRGKFSASNVTLSHLEADQKIALLRWSIQQKNSTLVSRLLEICPDINDRSTGKTILYDAVETQDLNIVSLVLNRKATVLPLAENDALALANTLGNEKIASQLRDHMKVGSEYIGPALRKIETELTTALTQLNNFSSILTLANSLAEKSKMVHSDASYTKEMGRVISERKLLPILKLPIEKGKDLLNSLLAARLGPYANGSRKQEEDAQSAYKELSGLLTEAVKDRSQYAYVINRQKGVPDDLTDFCFAVASQAIDAVNQMLKQKNHISCADSSTRKFLFDMLRYQRPQNIELISLILDKFLLMPKHRIEEVFSFLPIRELDPGLKSRMQKEAGQVLYTLFTDETVPLLQREIKAEEHMKHYGIDPNYKDPGSGQTIFHFYMRSPNLKHDFIHCLFQNNADPFIYDNKRATAYSLRDLNNTAQVKQFNTMIQQRLKSSLDRGNLEDMKKCIAHGALLNQEHLWQAARVGAKEEIVTFLLEKGLDPMDLDYYRETPLRVSRKKDPNSETTKAFERFIAKSPLRFHLRYIGQISHYGGSQIANILKTGGMLLWFSPQIAFWGTVFITWKLAPGLLRRVYPDLLPPDQEEQRPRR